MDPARDIELAYRLEHRHADGSWGEMIEQRSHHDPSQHDPERKWGTRRIFRCTSCDETAILVPGDEGGPPEAGP